MVKQLSFSAESELLKRLANAQSMREKFNPLGSTSRSKYLIYLIKKALEIEEKELEQFGSKIR
ncbi:hypothetical protein ACFLRN_04555 [Thermoproteota archaeon]